jgi:hypothetical protein
MLSNTEKHEIFSLKEEMSKCPASVKENSEVWRSALSNREVNTFTLNEEFVLTAIIEELSGISSNRLRNYIILSSGVSGDWPLIREVLEVLSCDLEDVAMHMDSLPATCRLRLETGL